MKRILVVLAILFMSGTVISQEINKPLYVVNEDGIAVTMYHDNGAIAQTGNYSLENKLKGEWKSYDVDGNITSLAYYNNGQKVGTWMFYQGDSIKEVVYMDSRISKIKSWTVSDTRVVSNR